MYLLFHLVDTNKNCECSGYSPGSANGVGKTCTTEKGKYGEPWCWVRGKYRYACTDWRRDKKDDHIDGLTAGTGSNWSYSTNACIGKYIK